MFAELTPCGGGAPIPLFLRRVVIGRARDCDVTIAARSVSSKHCEITFDGTHWHVRDIGSRNGTAVNGERCVEMTLQAGDIISFARERYSFRCDQATQSPAAHQPRTATESNKPSPPQNNQSTPSASESTLIGRLVPCGGGDPIPLLKPILTVGRRNHCDIQLRFTNVSSEHCRLEFKQGFWFVEDLKSTNGLKVDGMRCTSSWLEPESVLSIANHRYQIAYTPTEETRPPDADPFAMGLLEKAGLAQNDDSNATTKWAREQDEQPKAKRWKLDDVE